MVTKLIKHVFLGLLLTVAAACSSPGGFQQNLGPDSIPDASVSADLEKTWNIEFVTSNTNCPLDEVGATFNNLVTVAGQTCTSSTYSSISDDNKNCVAGGSEFGYEVTYTDIDQNDEGADCTKVTTFTYTAVLDDDGNLTGAWSGTMDVSGNCSFSDPDYPDVTQLVDCSSSGELDGVPYTSSTDTVSPIEDTETTGSGSTTGTSTGSTSGSSTGSTTSSSTTGGSTTGGSTTGGSSSGSSSGTSSGSTSGGGSTFPVTLTLASVTRDTTTSEVIISYKVTNNQSTAKTYNARYLIKGVTGGTGAFTPTTGCPPGPRVVCAFDVLVSGMTVSAHSAKSKTVRVPYPINGSGVTPAGFYDVTIFLQEARGARVATDGPTKIKL